MAYKHGIDVREQPTSVKPPVRAEGCLPVIVGAAPIHLAAYESLDAASSAVNKPILCQNYKEAVEQLGYKPDFKNYGIAEAIYVFFVLYGTGPVVFINVLDPKKHTKNVTATTVNVVDHVATVNDDVVIDASLVVKGGTGSTTLQKDTDFTASYDDKGNLVIELLSGGSAYEQTTLSVAYKAIDPTKVTKEDVIGGIDVSTGASKGLECVSDVYGRLGMVPGQIGAPGFSNDAEVAAIMASKAASVTGTFTAYAEVDIDTNEVQKYSDVYAYKSKNGLTSVYQHLNWPMVSNTDKQFHMSTMWMAQQCLLTSGNDDIPYKSPSNKEAKITGLCLADGTEVEVPKTNGDYLNGIGVSTCINYAGKWRTWGNRMACYPNNTDPKDAFQVCRAMFNWDRQTIIRTYFDTVDENLAPKTIQSIVDSENIRMNGLVAGEYIAAGSCEYRGDANPTTDIIDGMFNLHKVFTPFVPARHITMIQEFDPEAYKAFLG